MTSVLQALAAKQIVIADRLHLGQGIGIGIGHVSPTRNAAHLFVLEGLDKIPDGTV